MSEITENPPFQFRRAERRRDWRRAWIGLRLQPSVTLQRVKGGLQQTIRVRDGGALRAARRSQWCEMKKGLARVGI